MLRAVIFLIFLAGCSDDGPAAGNRTSAATTNQVSGALLEPPFQLIGLYEGRRSGAIDQMCVVQRKGTARFGLVVWGAQSHSCSGSGTISRKGEDIRLEMDGDSACVMQATLAGNTITLASDQPPGCAYYCGARARLAGAVLAHTGATERDAMKAEDLVGEPLCGNF